MCLNVFEVMFLGLIERVLLVFGVVDVVYIVVYYIGIILFEY